MSPRATTLDASISAVIRPAGLVALVLLASASSASTRAATLQGGTPGPDPAASAKAPPADPTTLRVCAAASQLPYSSRDETGFENKIAAVVAKTMNRKPVFVWSSKPAIYLVRDWLEKNKCDVVVGLDAGDQRVLTTKPYFRAGYVFVSRKNKDLAGIDSWADPKIKSLGHIVVDLGSPSEAMLKELGVYNDNMAYLYSLVNFRAPRNEYVQIAPERMVGEVRDGGADLAAGFAPDVARYVKADPGLVMVPIKDDAITTQGEKLPQQYDQAMGVRLGDTTLRDALDKAIGSAKPEIDAVLAAEGVPSPESQK